MSEERRAQSHFFNHILPKLKATYGEMSPEKEDEVIEHSMITRAVENAQRKVEGHNFDVRKQLLEYDNVINEQRKVIYAQRDEIMLAPDISAMINGFFSVNISLIY